MARTSAAHHADRVLAVLQQPAEADGIAASWRRCLLQHRLDPEHPHPPTLLSNLELRYVRGHAGRLMRVADPELDRLHGLVHGIGYSVLMTNRQGAVIARRVAERDERGCRDWRLWTGALWSEEVEGTNGVGTCLAEERPVSVHRDQHFRRRHTALTCTVTPLFDAAGRLAGALDISCFRPGPEGCILPLAMAAVQEAARRIEAAYFHDIHARFLILALPRPQDGRTDDTSVPLLALDADRRIQGATRAARAALRLDDAALERGVSITGALDGLQAEPRTFRAAERGVISAALAQSQGHVGQAASLLGISRATLHRKIRALGLQRADGFR
ncbi:Sigma-54-dependent Fis family transcriptional regulator [Rhodovastum atsumiense]|uniref:Sigma-54-dependent Fis family transcriptional regulator n=1 Tax=Rhodovastum atsumiense TaxID=504468 RepID=A0A5M6IQF2_9PROT|nr:helix-turn-helix domain-containing protein [Rhodovastum atsumiense]KAA5610441.1 sigma-54-dependent Fis family transcriptional regulator [Rhodovastum atsumiense]CAH2600424.1 Sigma-54-dependent Fis family transcriptional regulator [Rhodovastum atsumiense]